MKRLTTLLASGLLLAFASGCAAKSGTTLPPSPNLGLVPRPVSMINSDALRTPVESELTITYSGAETGPAGRAAKFFATSIAPELGLKATTKAAAKPTGSGIHFTTDGADAALNDEGYTLNVDADGSGAVIRAKTYSGLFYGAQTLSQVLTSTPGAKALPMGLAIKDEPRFGWRSLMLDPCRHFVEFKDVKRFVDLASRHKINTIHLHLTEDQGWRIEIKKYPRLTEIGSNREQTVIGRNSGKFDGKPHGGYYTQEQLRELVAYASDRAVTLVPEIEMPGHAMAALSAYPGLSCTGGPFKVSQTWGVFDDVYCAGNPQTYKFLEDVLDETIAIFPGKFIHIGGDECPKTRWDKCPKCIEMRKKNNLRNSHELQSHVVRHMDKYLESKGRRLIGWDEILEGGLAPGAAVMSWRGESGGITAALAGHDVVMASNSHLYLDYYQGPADKEPLAIGGFIPLAQVYGYDPIPAKLRDTSKARHILGLQAQLWSEYMPDFKHVEYMAYPRACAVAETGWTPAAAKNFDDFTKRIEVHMPRLAKLDVNYRPLDPKPFASWKSGELQTVFAPHSWDITGKLPADRDSIVVTFQYTTGQHRMDIRKVSLVADGKTVASDAHKGSTGSAHKDNTYRLRLPKEISTAARIELVAEVRTVGGNDSNGTITIAR